MCPLPPKQQLCLQQHTTEQLAASTSCTEAAHNTVKSSTTSSEVHSAGIMCTAVHAFAHSTSKKARQALAAEAPALRLHEAMCGGYATPAMMQAATISLKFLRHNNSALSPSAQNA
jgi:hypothetical protein